MEAVNSSSPHKPTEVDSEALTSDNQGPKIHQKHLVNNNGKASQPNDLDVPTQDKDFNLRTIDNSDKSSKDNVSEQKLSSKDIDLPKEDIDGVDANDALENTKNQPTMSKNIFPL